MAVCPRSPYSLLSQQAQLITWASAELFDFDSSDLLRSPQAFSRVKARNLAPLFPSCFSSSISIIVPSSFHHLDLCETGATFRPSRGPLGGPRIWWTPWKYTQTFERGGGCISTPSSKALLNKASTWRTQPPGEHLDTFRRPGRQSFRHLRTFGALRGTPMYLSNLRPSSLYSSSSVSKIASVGGPCGPPVLEIALEASSLIQSVQVIFYGELPSSMAFNWL